MSTLKTVTSTLTAAALVTGISLAWAQSEPTPPADPMTPATALPLNEQSPADPAAQPVDATMQQQQPADGSTPMPAEPARDSTPQPAAASPDMTTSTMPAEPAYEPAPRADRN